MWRFWYCVVSSIQVMTTFMPPPPAATFLAFHPQDNNIIAIGMEDSTIQIYNVRVDEVYYRVVPSLSSFAFLPAVLFSVSYVLSFQLKLGMMCLICLPAFHRLRASWRAIRRELLAWHSPILSMYLYHQGQMLRYVLGLQLNAGLNLQSCLVFFTCEG